jgi:hypothetical protein
LERENSRLKSALKVLSLIRETEQSVLLITYDPLLILLLKPVSNRVYLYEHNTVPESFLSKHALLQWVFLRKFTRLTQYPIQIEPLQRLAQDAIYIGSPLNHPTSRTVSNPKNSLSHVILAPGSRANVNALNAFEDILINFFIYAKASEKIPELTGTKLTINYQNYLNFPTNKNNWKVDAIIISSEGKYRGSGWFNDALSAGVPIIITSSDNKRIFNETFGKCNYIDLCKIDSYHTLKEKLLSEEYIFSPKDIIEHNKKIKIRLRNLFSFE